MKTRLKIIACLIWITGFVAFISFQIHSSANSNSSKSDTGKTNPKPDKVQVEKFDKALQERFFTEPSFGIRRLEPAYKPNPHFENFDFVQFNPKTKEEQLSIEAFEKEDWKVSLYLFGRRAIPQDANEKEPKEFNIQYRLNRPLLVTKNVKIKQVTNPGKFREEIKSAFDSFQNPSSPNYENYEFSVGKWSYVARPVRAANESCIKCHTDYVALPQPGTDEYQFRRRQVGDANGILVYGFAKDK
jgi:hypothetical protein